MKKFIILIILIPLSILLSAQGDDEKTTMGDYEAKENLRELGSTSGTGTIKTFDNRYQGVKGTPYVFEQWFPGEIFLKEKKRVYFPNINYDVIENNIVYREESGGTILEVNRRIIDFFLIYAEDTLTFVPVVLENSSAESFAEKLYSGKTNLYRVYQKEFLQANYEGGYSADRPYDQFVDKTSFFVKFPGKEVAEKIKPGKGMSKQFPEHQAEMKKYVDKYSAKDLKNDMILAEIMKYYDLL